MGSNKIFSQLDLKNGFNQIRLTEETKQYTSFTLLGNQYEYNRIPFGMKPGPKILQRQISRILKDIPNIFVYIDDIVVYSQNEEEHTKILKIVLERLFEKKVKINFEKSNFFKPELDVLGYKINSEGIYPKTKSLDTQILNRPVRTKKDLQRLIVTLNWYRKFIPGLSTRIYEVTNLLKNNIGRIQITPEMREELKRIEGEIRGNVKLSFPDYTKKITLECDASDFGLGSVLRQDDKVLGYFSKKLHGSELIYSIVEKEYLAML